jgi:putative glutamine amidotransferase
MRPLVGPLVGITSDYQSESPGGDKSPGEDKSPGRGKPRFYSLAEEYVEAIAACGGIPVILPPIKADTSKAIISRLDALLISGGDFDIDPALYGEAPHPALGALNPRRTEYELGLLRAALEKDMPLLAVCGGLQLLNVAQGGSLYQHLPAQHDSRINHEQKGKQAATAHTISVKPKSSLHDLLRTTEIMVNSTHHQAINRLGEGLIAVAHSADGIIEAAEYPACRFALGVQWHPEALIGYQPVWKRLFERLVQKAR